MSTWVPFGLPWDDAPLDLSFLYEGERPAGRHGFLGVDGPRFAFEDGTEARFWGTLFNAAAMFPTHDQSERIADRLAKFGVNLVRTMQWDAEWSSPNLFRFNPVRAKTDTRSLDPESMDRLDYLVSCLKDRGIYLYLDMLCYRRFLPGDGVDAAQDLPEYFPSYAYFDPRMIELQKEFTEQLWTHGNPYTGLAYRDEPAVALVTLFNEVDLFEVPPTLEPYRSRLEIRYREWADREGLTLPGEPVDFAAPDPTMARFFAEVHETFYRDMIAHLRSLGVRIPITGTNKSYNLGLLGSQLVTDFTDNHAYYNFPHWHDSMGTTTWKMVERIGNGFRMGAGHRVLDKPFVLSEWDHCWPDEWRAESPLAYASLAAFQGWSGAAIHTYRYGTHGPVDSLGGGASTLNGVTYRRLFETFNDPAKWGLFYHAALLFRRGDVRVGERRASIEVADDPAGAWRLRRLQEVPAVAIAAERHVVGMSLPGYRAAADVVLPWEEPTVEEEVGEVTSDTDELYRSWHRAYATIDSARTKAAYGMLGAAGPIELDGLALRIDTDFATVAVSSLTDDAIADSPSLLLTAVGRCDNSEARYDQSHRWQLDLGHGPILIEAIEGEISLTTTRDDLKVWVIGEHGEHMARVPATLADGRLTFRIGLLPHSSYEDITNFRWWPEGSIYYLIRA